MIQRKIVHGRALSWLPSLPDQRDLLYKSSGPLTLAPDFKMDLKKDLPSPHDQQQYNDCSGNATASAIDLLQVRELRTPGQQAQEYDPSTFLASSRLFLYYNGRTYIGMQAVDSGAYVRDVIKGAYSFGVCPESMWAYNSRNLLRKPTLGPMNIARRYKITKYMRLVTVDDIKGCLLDTFPVIFGAPLYDSFFQASTTSTGLVTNPAASEVMRGGHCMLIVGIDETLQAFDILNSWGVSWGNQGFGKIPYSYVAKLCSDFWTVRG